LGGLDPILKWELIDTTASLKILLVKSVEKNKVKRKKNAEL
jgi:hypothetical protein